MEGKAEQMEETVHQGKQMRQTDDLAKLANAPEGTIEVVEPWELQGLLRDPMFGLQDSEIEVIVKSDMMPWDATIAGKIDIYGQKHFWSVDIDLRDLRDADSVLLLVSQLHQSFEKAAKQVGRPQ
jgi:hypothetical protein